MEWVILIDSLVDRYMFEGSLIQEDVRQVSKLVQSVVILFLNQYEVKLQWVSKSSTTWNPPYLPLVSI
jgi:hypothetical protein